jgi:hypothetical protein
MGCSNYKDPVAFEKTFWLTTGVYRNPKGFSFSPMSFAMEYSFMEEFFNASVNEF